MEETNLKNENNKNLLEEVYQILKEVLNCTNAVFDKTCSEHFKKELLKIKQDFFEFKVECETLASTLGISFQNLNWIRRIKKSVSLNFNFLFEEETEKLAKVLIVNFNNSVIELIIAQDNNPNAIEEVKTLTTNVTRKLEKTIENAKKYLVKNPLCYNKKNENSEVKDKGKNKKINKSKSKNKKNFKEET